MFTTDAGRFLNRLIAYASFLFLHYVRLFITPHRAFHEFHVITFAVSLGFTSATDSSYDVLLSLADTG